MTISYTPTELVNCPRCHTENRACYLCRQQRQISRELAAAYLLIFGDRLTIGRRDAVITGTIEVIYQLRKDLDGVTMSLQDFRVYGLGPKRQIANIATLSPAGRNHD
jgi:hypothetical protein